MKKSYAPPLILTISNGLFLEFKSTAYGASNVRFLVGYDF